MKVYDIDIPAMFFNLNQIFGLSRDDVPLLRRENCLDDGFIRCLGNDDNDEECPGCESGVDYHGAHLLDGLIHPNCCSTKI